MYSVWHVLMLSDLYWTCGPWAVLSFSVGDIYTRAFSNVAIRAIHVASMMLTYENNAHTRAHFWFVNYPPLSTVWVCSEAVLHFQFHHTWFKLCPCSHLFTPVVWAESNRAPVIHCAGGADGVMGLLEMSAVARLFWLFVSRRKSPWNTPHAQ